MRSVTLHDEAKLEIGEAARWYEMREPGVGDDLWQCVEVALDMLESGQIIPGTPVPGRIAKHGVRRLLIERFSYSVVFVQHGNDVRVLAFAHHKRRPGYWRNRMKQGAR